MAIVYETEDRVLEVSKSEQSLLDICLKAKIAISHSCEGMASCGTCRVIVTENSDQLHERNHLETEMAEDRGFAPEERLACQLETNASFKFKLPAD